MFLKRVPIHICDIPGVRCPLCEQSESCMLWKNQRCIGGILPAPVPGGEWEFRCPSCKFCVKLDLKEDAAEAAKAEAICKAVRKHTMSPKRAEEALVALRFHAIESRKSDTPAPVCAACGEESPANFACCWNCNTPFDCPTDEASGLELPCKDGAHFIEDSPGQGLKL